MDTVSDRLLAVEMMVPGAAADKLVERELSGTREAFRVALLETQYDREMYDFIGVDVWLDEHGKRIDAHDHLRSHLLDIWTDIPDARQVQIAESGHHDVHYDWHPPDPRENTGGSR